MSWTWALGFNKGENYASFLARDKFKLLFLKVVIFNFYQLEDCDWSLDPT